MCAPAWASSWGPQLWCQQCGVFLSCVGIHAGPTKRYVISSWEDMSWYTISSNEFQGPHDAHNDKCVHDCKCCAGVSNISNEYNLRTSTNKNAQIWKKFCIKRLHIKHSRTLYLQHINTVKANFLICVFLASLGL